MTPPHPAGNEPMPGPQQVPPAFTPNGHSASQIAVALMQQMPQMLTDALASVLSQVPVHTTGSRYRCAGCVMGRLQWITAHRHEADTANAAYAKAMAEAAAAPDDDPRKHIPLEFAMFLPQVLRPGAEQGMPLIAEGTVMIGGTAYCMEHVPGAPGKTQLLVATAGMSPSMLGALG